MTEWNDAWITDCNSISYAPNESFIQRIKTDEYNDEIEFLMGEQDPTSGWVYLNGQPTWVTSAGYKSYVKESALPKWEAVVLFFYNYWWIPSIIILAIIAVSAI